MRSTRDDAWMRSLFAQHADEIRAYCVRRTDSHAADDLVSEVFTLAWRNRSKVPDEARVWLYATARNVVLHAQRSHTRRLRLVTEAGAVADGRNHSAENASRALAESLLSDLPEADAEVLRLAVWEQLTSTEIAQVLEVGDDVVRARLSRARRRARALVADLNSPESERSAK